MTRITLAQCATLLALAACSDEAPIAPAEPVEEIEEAPAMLSVHGDAPFQLSDHRARHLRLRVTVRNADTGEQIGWRTPLGTPFQVTVSTNDVDCAGQFVVTALGSSGAPPSVLVQAVPFIIGPGVGSNAVTGAILQAAGVDNDWKVTASCNGAKRGQIAFAFHEFLVK
jgi:hypothetical protein